MIWAEECFLVMEFCEKDLVNILESRGAAYLKEKQILLMFRDALPIAPHLHTRI
jgi:AP2-associated kinase